MLLIDYADYTTPTRQHELQIDHTDRSYLACIIWYMSGINLSALHDLEHEVGIDYLLPRCVSVQESSVSYMALTSVGLWHWRCLIRPRKKAGLGAGTAYVLAVVFC